MKKTFTLFFSILLIFIGINSSALPSSEQKLDKFKKQDMIEKIANIILEKYIFPETAQKITRHLRERYKAGDYEKIPNLQEFLRKLTQDVQEISKDRHFGLIPGKRSFSGDSMDERWKKSYLERMQFNNFGFKNVDK